MVHGEKCFIFKETRLNFLKKKMFGGGEWVCYGGFLGCNFLNSYALKIKLIVTN